MSSRKSTFEENTAHSNQGYVELHDYEAKILSKADSTMNIAPHTKRWIELVNEASSQFGKESA